MLLTIILEKEVVDEAAGNAVVVIVKQKLAQYPEVRIHASVHEELKGQ